MLSQAVRESAHPLTGASQDYDLLMEQIDDARFVLIGEASHGTHDFYQQRAEITKRLIQEKGFTAVAIEGEECRGILPLHVPGSGIIMESARSPHGRNSRSAR